MSVTEPLANSEKHFGNNWGCDLLSIKTGRLFLSPIIDVETEENPLWSAFPFCAMGRKGESKHNLAREGYYF